MGIWMGISFKWIFIYEYHEYQNYHQSQTLLTFHCHVWLPEAIFSMRFEHVPAWPDRQSAAERFRQHALPQDITATNNTNSKQIAWKKMTIGDFTVVIIHDYPWLFLIPCRTLEEICAVLLARLALGVCKSVSPFLGSIQGKHLLSLHPAVVILLANWTWRQYKTFGLSPPVWRQWQPRRPFLPPTMKIDAELVHECPWPRSFRRRNWWWKWKNTNRLQPMPSGSAVYRWVALGLLRSTEFTVPLDPQGNRLSGRGRIHSICKLYNVYT